MEGTCSSRRETISPWNVSRIWCWWCWYVLVIKKSKKNMGRYSKNILEISATFSLAYGSRRGTLLHRQDIWANCHELSAKAMLYTTYEKKLPLPSPSSQWSGCPHSVVPASQGWMDQLQKHLLQLELVKSSQCFSSALDIGQHTCCPRWIRHVCDWLVQLVCGMNGLCIDLIPFVLFYCGQFLNSLYLLFQEKINIWSHST